MATDPIDLDALLASSDDLLDRFPYDAVRPGPDTPPGLPQSRLGIHLGFFVGWAARRGLLSKQFVDQHQAAIDKYMLGAISARELLADAFHDTLTVEALSDRGNAFARKHYRTGWRHHYFTDLEALFPDLDDLAFIPESEESEHRIFRLLDRRLEEAEKE